MRAADVVVVGGGVMGLHVAGRLAAARAGRVVLFEQRRFGAGESGKSGAILRQHYSHAVLVRMARASLAEYAELHERTPGGVGFRQPGMLFLCHERDRAVLEKNVALQHSLGVPVSILRAGELREIDPAATFEDFVIGAHERDSAFVDPAKALPALAEQARAAGAELVEHARVVDVLLERAPGAAEARRVSGVELADGTRVAAKVVVNAGGPWAALLCRRLGLELPLSVVRPEQAFFAPPRDAPGERPIVLDLPNGAYWKTEPSGLTRVGALSYEHDEKVADPDHYDEGVSGRFVADCRARIARRVPAYADAVSWGGCGALYTVTPDAQAVIGPIAGLDGFLVCSGFSGHGFKLGPAVGRAVAALVTATDPGPCDLTFFAADRFARDRRHAGAWEYGVLG